MYRVFQKELYNFETPCIFIFKRYSPWVQWRRYCNS